MFSRHQITVLIVEDETSVAEYFRRVVSSLGFDVCQAATTGQALDMIGEADILFLDLKLPGVEQGDLVLERWIEKRRMPVAILSGHVSRDNENQFLAQGAWNVIIKPIEIEVLQALSIRYGLFIVDMRERAALAAEVHDLSIQTNRLRRAILVLLFALILIGGGNAVAPWVGTLLGL